jgi:isopentenyl-diphosphate delta-isomerase
VLGAKMCALAYPFLYAASQSEETLVKFTELIITELKSVMFLTGSSNISQLPTLRYILTGELADRVTKNE